MQLGVSPLLPALPLPFSFSTIHRRQEAGAKTTTVFSCFGLVFVFVWFLFLFCFVLVLSLKGNLGDGSKIGRKEQLIGGLITSIRAWGGEVLSYLRMSDWVVEISFNHSFTIWKIKKIGIQPNKRRKRNHSINHDEPQRGIPFKSKVVKTKMGAQGPKLRSQETQNKEEQRSCSEGIPLFHCISFSLPPNQTKPTKKSPKRKV